jgi:hypothetical protein
LLAPPRFGERVGYCPTFMMADEAQQSATPRDAEFKAVCRSFAALLGPTVVRLELGSGPRFRC